MSKVDLPMVLLDKHHPKLQNEVWVDLFLSDEQFDRIRKVRGGYKVPILALNNMETAK